MTKDEAAQIIAREVINIILSGGGKDGKAIAQDVVSEWHAGHKGSYFQEVAQTNGYEVKDIARVIRASKTRAAELQAAARDKATLGRLQGGGAKVHHWKHGWIPLDHPAAMPHKSN